MIPCPEVEPLNVGPNNALRYNALKTTKKIGVLIDSVITRRTVRGDESFVSNPFLREHFDRTNGSKNVILRATRCNSSTNESQNYVRLSMARPLECLRL